MKHSQSNVNTWVLTGYELFAVEGMESISIERLARIVGLNKSGFYHHFVDREGFLEKLLEHHCAMARQIIADMLTIREIDPDLLRILIRWKTSVLAHQQLVKNRNHKRCLECLNKVNGLVDPIVIPRWASAIGLHNNPKLAFHYYEVVRDMFYARLTPDLFTEAAMRELVVNEARRILELLMKEEQNAFPADSAD